IFGIFIGATVFAAVLRGLGGDDVIRDAITGLPFGTTGILITVLFITFLLGFFLDWVEITLIILPLVAPVVFSLGVEPVWFAVMFAICLQTSFLTPPVGFSLFYIKGVCPPGITTRHIYLGVLPFIALQLLGLALVFWFEPLATWLPNEVYGGR
ncbi:MAG: TRAP transporter large permease subunit, partial [Marinobacter sp.]|nr:TRAP transporter large permease subunit [Marinobacter sp.]